MSRARNWCFTYNADEEQAVSWLTANPPLTIELGSYTKYLHYQLEKAPTTGQIHLQGFVCFEALKTMQQAKDYFESSTIHVDKMLGTVAQNIVYCSKSATKLAGPWTLGEAPKGAGHRSDLDGVSEAIHAGVSKRQLAMDFPVAVIKYAKGIDNLRHALDYSPKWRTMTVTYIWGDAGVGKTRAVWDSVDDPTKLYKVEGDGKWWDGYDGQEAILFDDFRGQIPFLRMLEYIDGHPVQMEVKGAHVYAKYTKVWITANRPVDQQYQKKHAMPNENESWWEDLLTPEERNAWTRRITEVIHMQ